MSDHNHRCGHEEHSTCVSRVPIFNHLENDQMDEITKAIQSDTYKKGEIIYRAGEESDSLYIVKSGRVKIYRLSESGKEQLVRFLSAGDFTGELALFSDSVHESFAEAVENTEVCLIRRRDLHTFLMKYPSISLKILTEFSNRLENLRSKLPEFPRKGLKTQTRTFPGGVHR